MTKKGKRMLALLLSASMVLPSVGMNVVAETTASDEVQALAIEALEFTGKSIEKQRTTEDAALLTIYNRVKGEAPTLSEDGSRIILPETGDENYEISLYGSSNKAVIDMEGNVTQPLEDMNVYLYYKVTNVTTQENLHMDDPVYVKINGRYNDDQKSINRPKVMPGIREWKGSEGSFVFNGSLVIESEEVRDAAEIVEFYIEEMAGVDVEIKTGEAAAGDIALAYDETLTVGEEGYVLAIDDIAQVSAPEYKGVVYAGATIAQILMQSAGNTLPKGLMRDYPQYEVRSTMLDVARFYMPLDYLEEVTKYAAFFKQSEIHIHINDNGGEQSTAFRVESKKYPEINSNLNPDEVYSQEDYKAYQKEVKKYGIDVVTEIDTPAHAGFVALYDSSLMLDGYHIDLSRREPIEFMKSLFDEFLDGEDPVFQNNKFNIGTDEYGDGHNEEMRAYMDEMIKYVASKGYEARLWSGLNVEGKKYWGTTPVTNENAVFHYWAASFADLQTQLSGEYVMINNNDGRLYSVPEIGYYNDYLNIASLYTSWQAGIVPGNSHIYPGHPLLIGSEAALWYDAKLGVSEFDVFDRHRDQIMLMAEKNWYGEPTEGQTSAEFMERVTALGNKAPGVNPDRQVVSETEIIAEYDFTAAADGIVKDLSSNGYDAKVNGLKTSKVGLVLNGAGFVSLPFDTVGYPYTVDFELYVSSATGENAVIFDGADGTMYYNYDGTGKIGYERKGYSYLFDYDVLEDTMNRFSITCNTPDRDGQLRLFVNGAEVATGDYYKVTGSSREESSTFVLPTEAIGSGIRGYLKSLKIKNMVAVDAIQSENNIALNKSVAASGIEGGYNEDGTLVYPQFDPMHATDGTVSSRISLERKHDAWFYVDLGGDALVDKVVLNFGELPNAYEIQVSLDGEHWTTVETRMGLEGSTKSIQTIVLPETIRTRYVKYQQIEMFEHPGGYGIYSGNFSEFEVYGIELSEIQNVIDEANTALAEVAETEANAVFRNIMLQKIEAIEQALATDSFTGLTTALRILKNQTKDLYAGNTNAVETDKAELEQLLNEKVDVSLFTSETAEDYLQELQAGENVFADVTCTQAHVDNAVKGIKKAKASLQMKAAIEITTNCTIYQTNTQDLILDGSTSTTFWKNGYQKSGDYIKIAFREPFALTTVQLIADRDILKYGDLQISTDGLNYTTVATLAQTSDQTITLSEETQVLGIKILATQSNDDAWWRLNEVVLNGASIKTADKKVLAFELEKEVDGSAYTNATYEAYENAKAAALTVYENDAATQNQVDEATSSIRNAYAALELLVDKDELQTLVNNLISNEDETYTQESFAVYTAAIEQAKEVLENQDASQSQIESAIWKIEESIVYLEENPEEEVVFEIVTQPVDTSAAKGEDAAVFVGATGKGLTYKWYYKNPGNKKFYESGADFVSEDGTTYTIPMYAWRNGQEVYCVVTDANGESIQSNTVTLTFDNGSIQILKQPEDAVVDVAGGEAVVTVEATGTDLTYQW